jgi:5'-deoxy-5'-methylthioadenosine phosphorylase
LDAIIGGSQLASFDGLTEVRHERITTPYGDPSAPITLGKIAGRSVAFVPRHGDPHVLPPHRVNYRANVWALRSVGATHVVAIATAGGMRDGFTPGTLVVPDQIIDYTWGRAHTFSDGDKPEPVLHVDFTEPFCEGLRQRLLASGARANTTLADGGCYACFNGPRLESAAEIRKFMRDGCDLVGQTLMPEAGLAREAGLEYAALCPIVNPAAGLGASRQGISREELIATRGAAMARVAALLVEFLAGAQAPCAA